MEPVLQGYFGELERLAKDGDKEAPSIADVEDTLLIRWRAFEKARPATHTYVYVDAENVIKTIETVFDLKWPSNTPAKDLVAVIADACGSWVQPPDRTRKDMAWIVYAKRKVDGDNVFCVPGQGPGDETDDVLAVAAACARTEQENALVYLVSGDEMRWTQSSSKVADAWAQVKRGPRAQSHERNRLVDQFMALRERCKARDFAGLMECTSRSPETDTPAVTVTDANDDRVDETAARQASVADHAASSLQTLPGPRSGTSDAWIVAMMLGASLIALTAASRL